MESVMIFVVSSQTTTVLVYEKYSALISLQWLAFKSAIDSLLTGSYFL